MMTMKHEGQIQYERNDVDNTGDDMAHYRIPVDYERVSMHVINAPAQVSCLSACKSVCVCYIMKNPGTKLPDVREKTL